MRISSFSALLLLAAGLHGKAVSGEATRPRFHAVNGSPLLADVDSLPGDELLIVAEGRQLAVLDAQGYALAGWPVRAPAGLVAPPLVLHGERGAAREILCASAAGPILRWRPDGSPLPSLEWNRDSLEIRVTPAVADLDGDGALEVAALSTDGLLMVWNTDGSRRAGWPVDLGAPALAGVAASGGNGAAGPALLTAGDDAGRLHAFRGDGLALAGWPVELGARLRASPCIVSRGERSPLIVASPYGLPWRFEAFSLEGVRETGWPLEVAGMVNDCLATGDLDGDGIEEVAFTERSGGVAIARAEGELDPAWPREARGELQHGPLLGDLDGDARPDLLVVSELRDLWVWNARGERLPGWPRDLGAAVSGSPALGDLDADGRVEIVVAYADGVLRCIETDGVASPGALPWPAERGLARTRLHELEPEVERTKPRVWQNLPNRRARDTVFEFELPADLPAVTLTLRGEDGARDTTLVDGDTRESGVHRLTLGPARDAGMAPGVHLAVLIAGADTCEAEIFLAP